MQHFYWSVTGKGWKLSNLQYTPAYNVLLRKDIEPESGAIIGDGDHN